MGIQFNLGDDAFFGQGRTFPDAIIDLDFRNGLYYWGEPVQLSDAVTCVRAGNDGLVPNADGTYSTTTANTPRVGIGTGIWSEQQISNFILWNTDLTNIVWVKVAATISPSLPAPIVGGAAGQQVIATLANATVAQVLTKSAATDLLSAVFYLANAGDVTGPIMLSQDGGITETDVSSALVVGKWVQIPMAAAQSVLNPAIRLRIANSGDKVGFTLPLLGNRNYLNTPIQTTTAPVTRNADLLSLNIGSFPALFTGDQLTVLMPFYPNGIGLTGFSMLDVTNAAGTNRQTFNAAVQTGKNFIGVTYVPPTNGIDPLTQFYVFQTWNVAGYSSKASTKTGITALRGDADIVTLGSWPDPTQFTNVMLGTQTVSGQSFLQGVIGRLVVLPTAWTQAQLAAWTSQAYP